MTSQFDTKWERFILICKPEQSGKTFIMIQKIIEDMEEEQDTKVINIIFCDNNLLLTKQTSTRVKNDLLQFKNGNDELYLEFSSHKRTKYHSVDSVLGAITYREELNNILCCTNGVRTSDVYEIISKANTQCPGKFYFKVWLDEADKFHGYIDDVFKPLINVYDNIQVYCITATPKSLFYKYKYMNVLPLENTTHENYHGWEDNNIRTFEDMGNVSRFTDHILTNQASLLKPGTKWFIPAETKKKTHEAIKDLCISKGFSVAIVNGDGIKLTLPVTKEVINLPKDDELNTKLINMYRDHGLDKYPFAITGNICIGRGISIMSNDFMIDYAIFSCTNKQQEVSQLAGRVKGNIKGWENYKVPTIFTTERFNEIAIEWENKSRNLARIAFEKEQKGESTMITKQEYKDIGGDYEYVVHQDMFNTFKEAQAFLKGMPIRTAMTPVGKKPIRATCSKKSSIHRRLETPLDTSQEGVKEPKNGYALSSKLGKVSEMTQDDRITMERACNPQAVGYIGPGTCISSTDKGSGFLILPVYDTLDSPANSEKYQVRYIKYK